jgi:predicted phage tail protein
MAKKMVKKRVGMKCNITQDMTELIEPATQHLGQQLADSIDAQILANIQKAVDNVAKNMEFGHKINAISMSSDGEVSVQMEVQPKKTLDYIEVQLKVDSVDELEDRFKAILDEVE